MKKRLRKDQVLKRKNFLPSLLFTILLWIILSGIIYFVDPDTFGALPLFFLALFTTLLFTTSLLLANTRRGLVITIALLLFMILRYFGVGNILNFILIAGLASTVELYFSRK